MSNQTPLLPTEDTIPLDHLADLVDELPPGLQPPQLLPSVVILGRPNVGKSTLFNKLIGRRQAIVGDEPGITRDRHYGVVEWLGRNFELVDTGGIVPDDEAIIPVNIFRQASFAIEGATLLLWVVDAREGVTPLDEELVRHLRATGKPVFIVANKVESESVRAAAGEFYRFGFDTLFPVSAEHGTGTAELLDAILDFTQAPVAAPPPPERIRVAVIGRPNVGKSSLINAILGEERVIVSPIAGTTRDAIDTDLVHNGRAFTLIDTAGIRRKGRTTAMAEKFSVIMARKALERADVAVLLLDAVEGPTHLDEVIAGYALESGTSILLALNKWDTIEKDANTAKLYERQLRERVKFLDYAPAVFISALTGQRVTRVLDLAVRAYDARYRRIPTGELNRFFTEHLATPRATMPTSTPVKVHYVTQARSVPPTFVLFTNSTKKLHFSYIRYVENRLRENFDFFATPLRIVSRPRLGKKS
ncbi:ribosome biogenesis GTPase Der [Chloracidobacterium validum]|uniref:GTPase Der n=1 Tax=Chloracidobacterium validum TaxID=2821543 RepID=A0ABX8B9S0_9BACT|nr:ribosome biogenesis GTPase Der [Chloracidobacterium validum]QUW02300.1 ribosome biogenesis GTPase Der [Chloracidobacterium validum]